MSLAFKGGAKTSVGNTYWVPKGEKFTVSVMLDDIRKLTYNEAHAKLDYGTTDIVEFSAVSFKTPPCVSNTDQFSDGSTVKVSCRTTGDAGNTNFTGNIFNLVFQCTDTNPGVVSVEEIRLIDPGTNTKLVDKSGAAVSPFIANKLTIRCVGPDSDKDKDGCTPAQEAAINEAIGVNLDPNVPDYWDTNNDDRIDIRDVLAYVDSFDQKPSGKVLDTDGDGRIDIDDIFNVIALYGTNCKDG